MDLQRNLKWHDIDAEHHKMPIISPNRENSRAESSDSLRFHKTRVRTYFALAFGIALSSVVFYTITTVSYRGFKTTPCDNFYEFSCQEWQINNPRPDWANDWGTFDVLDYQTSILVSEILDKPVGDHDIIAVKQAKDFYRKCLCSVSERNNSDSLNFIWNTLESYGGWPILFQNGTWDRSNFNWTKSVAALQNRFSYPVLFEISSRQSTSKNADQNRISIHKPGSNTLMRSRLVDELIDWFVQYILFLFSGNNPDVEIFILNLRNELLEFKQRKFTLEDWSQISDIFETARLFNKQKTERSQKLRLLFGFSQNSGLLTLETLQVMIDLFVGTGNRHFDDEWVKFRPLLEYVYEDVGVEVNDSTNLYVSDIEYVLEVSSQLHQLSDESLANYLHFIMTHRMAFLGGGNIRRSNDELMNKTSYQNMERPPRSKECSELAQNKFKFAVAHELVKKRYHDMDEFRHVRFEVQKIFNNIKSSMARHTRIWEGKAWLTEACIGFPDWIFESDIVQNEYNGLLLYNNQTYLEQTLILDAWIANNSLKLLKYPLSNKCSWITFPGLTPPFIHNDQSLVYLPMGVLQPPFFDINRPTALNYGSIGALIGHELGHAFSYSELMAYKGRPISTIQNCLKQQYSLFVGDLYPKALNGDQTLAENLADNIGLQEAYSAFFESENYLFERKYIHVNDNEGAKLERSFFLSFAKTWCVLYSTGGLKSHVDQDTHSPAMFRVLGTLHNSKEFKKAWGCPLGSKMNPVHKEHHTCELP